MVAGTLIGFRKPFSSFLKVVAQPGTKLSIASIFAVELPEVSTVEPPPPEASTRRQGKDIDFKVEILAVELPPPEASTRGLEIGLEDLNTRRALARSGDILPKLLEEEGSLEALIIDLGTGRQWLTSRLFIFTVMLQRMRGLRCIVFLETHTPWLRFRETRIRRFLGLASPDEVQQALAHRYPWLEQVDLRVQSDLLSRENMTLLQIKSMPNPEMRLRQEIHNFLDKFLREIQSNNGDQGFAPLSMLRI